LLTGAQIVISPADHSSKMPGIPPAYAGCCGALRVHLITAFGPTRQGEFGKAPRQLVGTAPTLEYWAFPADINCEWR